jgi:hypothetical protein
MQSETRSPGRGGVGNCGWRASYTLFENLLNRAPRNECTNISLTTSLRVDVSAAFRHIVVPDGSGQDAYKQGLLNRIGDFPKRRHHHFIMTVRSNFPRHFSSPTSSGA